MAVFQMYASMSWIELFLEQEKDLVNKSKQEMSAAKFNEETIRRKIRTATDGYYELVVQCNIESLAALLALKKHKAKMYALQLTALDLSTIIIDPDKENYKLDTDELLHYIMLNGSSFKDNHISDLIAELERATIIYDEKHLILTQTKTLLEDAQKNLTSIQFILDQDPAEYFSTEDKKAYMLLQKINDKFRTVAAQLNIASLYRSKICEFLTQAHDFIIIQSKKECIFGNCIDGIGLVPNESC
jgi:hypothetical protein